MLPRSATVRASADGVLVGYTVQAFRERLGAAGVRDRIERKPVPLDELDDVEPDSESGPALGDGEQGAGDALDLAD